MRLLRAMMILSLLAPLAAGAFALEFDVTGMAVAGTDDGLPMGTTRNAYPDFDLTISHQGTNGFDFIWDMGSDDSGRYKTMFNGNFGYKLIGSVLVKQGGLSWKNGDFSLEAGRLTLHDDVDSPYSIAISSMDNSALTGAFHYEDDRFFFTDRWIALNYNSGQTYADGNYWPDRSEVYKSYGLKFGDFRFGFQDIVVFTDLNTDGSGGNSREPLFDAEYFLDPAPAFMLQYALADSVSGGSNDNSLMGFYGTWTKDDYTLDAQFIVDDIDMNAILNPSGYQNPNKFAWTIGGSWKTDYGTFRFDHAGATKYTFEPTGIGSEYNDGYGYTYYPDTEYSLNGSMSTIDPESNMVGYLNGENNIAFMASWTKPMGAFVPSASLEFRVTGEQSPANPWAEATSFPSGTHLLDDPVLEKRVVLNGSASYSWNDFRFFASGKLGFAWNKLQLTAVAGEVNNSFANGIEIFEPSSQDGLIAAITIGATWVFKP